MWSCGQCIWMMIKYHGECIPITPPTSGSDTHECTISERVTTIILDESDRWTTLPTIRCGSLGHQSMLGISLYAHLLDSVPGILGHESKATRDPVPRMPSDCQTYNGIVRRLMHVGSRDSAYHIVRIHADKCPLAALVYPGPNDLSISMLPIPSET